MWPIDPHLFATFIVAGLLLDITPGPDMLFVLAAGSTGGPRTAPIGSECSTEGSDEGVIDLPGRFRVMHRALRSTRWLCRAPSRSSIEA